MKIYYSKSELVKLIRNRALALGRTPKASDFSDDEAKAIHSYFKKRTKAIKAADLNHLNSDSFTKTKSSEPKPLKVGKTPDNQNEKKVKHPSGRYSKAIIKNMLLAEMKRQGKRPTRKSIDENKNLPTVATCLKYFNTTRMQDVWDEILD